MARVRRGGSKVYHSHGHHFKETDTRAFLRKLIFFPFRFPTPSPPSNFRPNYIYDSIPIVLVSYSICISLTKLFAKKYKYSIDPNQEFIALGVSNVISSFFRCHPAAASLSRSSVQASVGGITQLTSLVASAIILVFILALGRLLEPVPSCVLAAIIVVNLKGMLMQFTELPRFWKLSKVDAIVWVVSFLVTFLIDVDIGLYVGVGFVLLSVVVRAAQTNVSNQHQVPDSELFQNVEQSKNLEDTKAVRVIRWDSPLYFANVEKFSSTLISNLDGKTHIIFDMSGISFIDSTGINAISTAISDCAKGKVQLIFSSCPEKVWKSLANDSELFPKMLEKTYKTTIDAFTAIKSDVNVK